MWRCLMSSPSIELVKSAIDSAIDNTESDNNFHFEVLVSDRAFMSLVQSGDIDPSDEQWYRGRYKGYGIVIDNNHFEFLDISTR